MRIRWDRSGSADFGDFFGFAIATSEDTVVVGALGENSDALGSGENVAVLVESAGLGFQTAMETHGDTFP